MYSDSFFCMGSTHTVCEDYARSGHTISGMAYAIVADGCSSSKDTDVGARIITLEAEKYIRAANRIPSGAEIAWLAKERIFGLGLPPEAMDATLIIALEWKGRIEVAGWGDGAFINTYGESDWEYCEFEYDPNYPFYLSYLTDPVRMQTWRDSGLGLTKTYIHSRKVLNESKKLEDAEGWQDEIYMGAGRVMFIASDGFSSFEKTLDGCRNPVDPALVAAEMVQVKNPKGKFVTKRIRRMVRNFKKDGIRNLDDFAVAGISNPRE